MQVVTITTSEPTIGNKIVETLYSNKVTSDNKVLVNKVSCLMTWFLRQKPLTSKIQKHTIVGSAKFYYRAISSIIMLLVSAQSVKNWKTSLKETTFWWLLTRRAIRVWSTLKQPWLLCAGEFSGKMFRLLTHSKAEKPCYISAVD